MTFSGSYPLDDVEFLLRPVGLETTEFTEKERLIQTGLKHYSEVISREAPPTAELRGYFERAVERNRRRLGRDIVVLARRLCADSSETVVLVSLARAGTPIGVLLRRTLRALGRPCVHYSISIIRDRGIDAAALRHILETHDSRAVVFVDGWTGKGAIARELALAIARFNQEHATRLSDGLHVVCDLAGVAEFAASSDDYLLPCSVLNATVSGLISRTIVNSECVSANEFHACLSYAEFAPMDQSTWFVDRIMEDVREELGRSGEAAVDSWSPARRSRLQADAARFLQEALRRYSLRDVHRVKPGIGEATRALLRRIPSRVLVADPADPDVTHLLWLAEQRQVPIERAEWIPYKAAAIIQSLGRD